jgi:hypothetical protein
VFDSETTLTDVTLVGYDEQDLPNPTLPSNLRRFAFNNTRGVPGFVWENEWKYLTDEARVAEIATSVFADNVFEFNLTEKIVYVNGSLPEIPGERYQSIGKACEYLSRFLPPYKNEWQTSTLLRNKIVIASGHVVNEQLLFDGVNFSQTIIIAEDATVTINPAGLSRLTEINDTIHSFIRVYEGAIGPVIATQFVLGPGTVPQDAQAIADGLVPNNYTPRPVWCHQTGTIRITAQRENVFGAPINPPRCGGAQGAWFRTIHTGINARTNVRDARISSSTGVAWRENGTAWVSTSVVRGSVASVECAGRLMISEIGAGPGQMIDNGDWAQDFRRDPAVDSAFDLRVHGGGLIRTVSNTRGGFSQAPNIWTNAGCIFSPSTSSFNYSTANLLGTVSQSGGVPTGAAIERGSNANGDYVRFADGTQICTTPFISFDVTTAVGSMFRSEVQTWTYPATFSTTANLVVMPGSANNPTTHWMSARLLNTTQAEICAFAPTSITNRSGRFTAIGRWF